LAWVPSQQGIGVRFMSESTELGSLSLTVANNAPEREPALQGRATLAPDAGVLFGWPEPTKDPFWMQNTTSPLDVAFVTSLENQGEVVGFEVTELRTLTQPSEEEIVPKRPYELAIVANRGFFERHNIGEGSDVVVAPSP